MTAFAQQQPTWEQVWHDISSPEDLDEEELAEDYECLQQLAEHPINLNSTSYEELEQLPFLSEQQIEELMEYIHSYGPMRSFGELRMLKSMGQRELALLPFFITLEEKEEEKTTFPKWATIAREGRHTLMATGRIPFYQRKGDESGYLGYEYRHSLRYEFSFGSYVKAGLIGAQDAGEPFFGKRNSWGYDTYSYYIQVQRMGWLENVIVGKYKVSTGLGLVLNTSFSLGKLSMLQKLGRKTNSLRVHSSRSEADYFQGAAATMRLLQPLSVTIFASYRPLDATLNDDGTAATIITNGYHRTLTEYEKKGNTHETDLGGSISFRQGGLHLGAHAVLTTLDRQLMPDTAVIYRRYYPQGDRFSNVSLDYGYTHHRFSLSGETATDRNGALATIHTLSFQPSSALSLMALQRFYSYRYTGYHAHSFGDNSRAQNESGFYLGFSWTPMGHLHLQGYADYAYFPWARYQAIDTSHAWDFLLQGDWQLQHWNIKARHRLRLGQKNNEEATALISDNEQRGRISVNYTHPAAWSTKTQLDYTHSAYKTTCSGYMISEHLGWQRNNWLLNLATGYFKTDDYNSRIYIYEHQMQHDIAFPMFYGEGLRLAFYVRADVIKNLRLSAKLGYTNYFDRSIIGTGQQQIAQAHTTDLDLQLRWKF
jgi:hypothetical protein